MANYQGGAETRFCCLPSAVCLWFMWCWCSEAAVLLPQPDKRDLRYSALKSRVFIWEVSYETDFKALMWSSDNSNKHTSQPNYMGNRTVQKPQKNILLLYLLHGTERNELTVSSNSCCDLGQALLILLNNSLLSIKSSPRGSIIFTMFLRNLVHLLRFVQLLSTLVYIIKICAYFNDI